ncbi:MerR family transcriptional regulator [Kitasatospora sp. NBC_01300]|uniref:MerR family transcriptional regulator n=1 Tax=Kitasatospora sp. NBC_01300 TaxID=2903574 RepID=UPI00352F16C7|nr:MerR family transcriptional regulator [Kitasatospora sp. NBC_01300]
MEQLYSITEVAQAFGLSVPALRYYEDCGLITPAARRGRVRQYDRAALERLALVQLWHVDGMIPLAGTAAVMASEQAAERKALLAAQRDEMTARARRLERAAAVLTHMLDCHRDRPLDCPVTHAHIGARVDAALAGEELADDFLPPAPPPPPATVSGTGTGPTPAPPASARRVAR